VTNRLEQRDYLIGGLIAAAAFACLYLPFLSKEFVKEGLFRAMPIETRHVNHLFPGNYLLYGPLGYLFHGILRMMGIHLLAVVSLQLMDALIGSFGLCVYFFIIRTIGGLRWEAVVWSLILGTSLGYWLWSTEAENYIFSTLLLQLNFLALMVMVRDGRLRPVVLGLLHGLAMLGHIVNLLYAAVILWTIYKVEGPAWRRTATRYLIAAGASILLAYVGVIILIKGFSSPIDAVHWFYGSAGATQGGVRFGGLPSLPKLASWITMTGHIFVSFIPAYGVPAGWPGAPIVLWMAKAILAAALFYGIIRLSAIYRENPVVAGACFMWLAAYALMFTHWEPWTMVYRVSDLVPLCTLLYVIMNYWTERWAVSRWLGPVLACSLMVGNLGAEIRPRSFETNNAELQSVLKIKNMTKDGDWVLARGGLDEIYLPYFADRRPILVDRYDAAQLREVVNRLLKSNQSIYLTGRTLVDPLWTAIASSYHLEPVSHDPVSEPLWRITHAGTPH